MLLHHPVDMSKLIKIRIANVQNVISYVLNFVHLNPSASLRTGLFRI